MAVTINGVSVDIGGRMIRDERGGLVLLRPQCFEVLRILLENSDRVVSKRELMREVWPDVAVTDDSLVQCIHEIRVALRDRNHSIIKTAQRHGYRLDNSTMTQAPLVTRPRFKPIELLVACISVLGAVSAGWWITLQSFETNNRHTDSLTSTLASMFGRTSSATGAPNTSSVSSARQAYLLGLYHLHKPGPRNLALAKSSFEEAIRLDPALSDAHVALAKAYARVGTQAESRALEINFDDAELKARRELEYVSARSAETHTVRSWLALRKFQIREAIAEAETALALKPDDTDAMEALARASIFGAEPQRGLVLAAEMMRQNPALADRALLLTGLAEFALGNYAAAVRDIERAMELSSGDNAYAGILAAAHSLLGNAERSRQAYQTFLTGFREQPDLARLMIIYPFADPRTAQLLAAGLESAGAKAWFSRDDGGYLRLDESSRLDGKEIAALLRNSRIEGRGFLCAKSWERGEGAYGLVEYDGTLIHSGMPQNVAGISSVEDDLSL